MDKLNEVTTRGELAQFLNIPHKKLTYILYNKKVDNCYSTFEIPKKNGGVRSINAPNEDLKDIQKKLYEVLVQAQENIILVEKIKDNISHGFKKSKGIITNAEVHKKKKFVLNVDIENFFDSFHFGRVRGFFEKNKYFALSREISTVLAQLTCYQGRLPQGAPTSPILTNLICNILDLRILKICRKFRLNYTRYADDLTFSTNDKYFQDNFDSFYSELSHEVEAFSLKINEKKTRLIFNDSRQEVTGITVNSKLNVNKIYIKHTRAMAEELYRKGEFYINDKIGSLNQLEGRFSFINQLDYYNNIQDNKLLSKKTKQNCWNLSSREMQYQKFLFYKYFIANQKPIIVTEGKTDILYIKAALKSMHLRYPQLITKKDKNFEYKVVFLKKTKKLEYFLGIYRDGANALVNIYNLHTGRNGFHNYLRLFNSVYKQQSKHPTILLFDNEQVTNRPLKKFLSSNSFSNAELTNTNLFLKLEENLFLLTIQLVKKMSECEIEDLFTSDVLNIQINGRTFSKDEEYNKSNHFGKSELSNYVYNNYEKIDFDGFVPVMDSIVKIVENQL